MELDPQTMGLLSAAFGGLQASGPSRTPVSLGQVIGQAGQAGLGGYQQGLQNQRQGILMQAQMAELERKKQQEQYLQQYAAQLPDAERSAFLVDPAGYIKAARETPFGKIDPEKFTPESVSAFMQSGGKNFSLLAPRIKYDPVETTDASGQPVTRFVNSYAPPTEGLARPVKNEVTAGGIAYNPYSMAPKGAFQDPNKPFGFVNDGTGFKLQANAPYQAFEMDRSKARATNVTVQPDNLGLKPRDRFDMEDKLRGDFRNNPTVKAADEMQSAFKLIETAKSRPSPQNDLAMATKFMKILDPGSVVRESELALAMNTSGVFDRVQNYANMLITGQKLTPTQREEFYKSAKEINDAFQFGRNDIAKRFEENATQYNLSPKNVVGDPPKMSGSEKMPAANPSNKGKYLTDTQTGERYQSNGFQWVKVPK